MNIETSRLLLVPLDVAFYRHSLARDEQRAEQHLGYAIGSDWFQQAELIALRMDQLARDPTLQEWLLRAIVLKAERRMVGHIGFHTKPAPEYLAEYSPTAVEVGYTVYEPYRRRGIAREAALGLFDWAHRAHGVTRFVASASPHNTPSVNMIRSLGFCVVGGHHDEIDGYEDVYEAVWPPE